MEYTKKFDIGNIPHLSWVFQAGKECCLKETWVKAGKIQFNISEMKSAPTIKKLSYL